MANIKVCDVIKAKPTPATHEDHLVSVTAVGRFVMDLSDAGLEKVETALGKHGDALEAYYEMEKRLQEEMDTKLADARANLLSKSGLDKILEGHDPIQEQEVSPTAKPVKGVSKAEQDRLGKAWRARVREWHAQPPRGNIISEKGRIPQDSIAAYLTAHPADKEPVFA